VTFSAQMREASICSIWTPDTSNQLLSAASNVVTVTNGAGAANDSISSVTSGSCTFNFGSIDLGFNTYVTGGNVTFGANGNGNQSIYAWNAAAHSLTITLGKQGVTGATGTVASSTPTYTASALITDSSGVGLTNSPFTQLPTAQRF
jgi:hypothetical protein